MKYHKILFSILLISNIIFVMLCNGDLEVIAQKSDSTGTGNVLGEFLDNNYERIREAKDFSESEAQTHPFVKDNNQCNTCHEVFQDSGFNASYIVFREDPGVSMTASCLKCHQQYIGDHPVLIKAPFPVPKDFPLSEKKEITCITCHNPHFQRFSNRPWFPRSFKTIIADFIKRKKEYKTYFLRRNNAEKELCLSCHKSVRYQWK